MLIKLFHPLEKIIYGHLCAISRHLEREDEIKRGRDEIKKKKYKYHKSYNGIRRK